MQQRTCNRCQTTYTRTHGRQVYCSPDCRKPKHSKVAVTCDCCGGTAMKAQSKPRYGATFCGTLCRDYGLYGSSACKIPKNHWARWYGRTSTWTHVTVRNTGKCEWCGGTNARDQQAAFCTTKCKNKAKGQRRRAAQHNAPGEYRYTDVAKQYITQGRVCAYCSRHCAGHLPDPEHVVALSRGGRNDMSNIVAACSSCNSDKRDLSLEEWQEHRKQRGLEPVNIDLTGPRFPRLHLATTSTLTLAA